MSTVIGSCPFCNENVFVDYSEPGKWCSDENIPDGEYEEKCGGCDKDFLIVIDWYPRLSVEEIYD